MKECIEQWDKKTEELTEKEIYQFSPLDYWKEGWKAALRWTLSKKFPDPETPTVSDPEVAYIIAARHIEKELEE